MLKKTEWTGKWGLKGPGWALAVYVLVLYPAVYLGLAGGPFLSDFLAPAYFAAVLALGLARKGFRWNQLGWNTVYWKQNLILGGLSGILIIASIPVMDGLLEVSGLSQSELFAGAENRGTGSGLSVEVLLPLLGALILAPLIEQTFYMGYVTQALFRATSPALAVYFGGLIFTLARFDFQLGTFFLGVIAAWFYYLTGSLLPGLLFQMSCALGGWLIFNLYPRLFTLLGFLF